MAFLVGCAGSPPAPVERRDTPAPPPVARKPVPQKSAGVQVYPLQNPAVKELLADARKAESAGNFDAAANSLERALRIQPRDPELLQQMAEIHLNKQDYEQALNFAVRSYDSGSRVGEICSRNWQTIGIAREQLGDRKGADEADLRANQCMNTKPRSY